MFMKCHAFDRKVPWNVYSVYPSCYEYHIDGHLKKINGVQLACHNYNLYSSDSKRGDNIVEDSTLFTAKLSEL